MTKDKVDTMQDKLQLIFERQQALDAFIYAQRPKLDWDISQQLQRLAMATIVETTELVSETNYKWWKNPTQLDMDAIQEELVDILHFFVSMCIAAGMDADMLYNLYVSKNQENYNRQIGTSKKQGYVAKHTQ
ncbi:MAG: dUTPase [Clostridiales bacterium]|jgi:dimeric dUTPase (all-alpha-NTP-PPase superfamily)|nr:dUTPase [Clostridiales bacterium]